MAIVASKGSSFTPCPAGTFCAVCIDVVDIGIVQSTYSGKTKKQHKVNIIWQIEEKRDDGKFFTPRKRYTLSLHEKASLRKDLESWRGRPFSDDELSGFDLENLIGAAAMICVVQAAVSGQVYANVTAIMKAPKGLAPPTPDPSYVRVQDRPTDQAPAGDVSDSNDWVPTDEDVPF